MLARTGHQSAGKDCSRVSSGYGNLHYNYSQFPRKISRRDLYRTKVLRLLQSRGVTALDFPKSNPNISSADVEVPHPISLKRNLLPAKQRYKLTSRCDCLCRYKLNQA